MHALLQQTPSTQNALKHSLPALQVCPVFFRHVPLASQLCVPLQLSSSALMTCTQVPPPPVQLWHVPQEGAPQQCPSTQLPLAQSPAALQVWPDTFLQAPVASQLFEPLQVSSVADFTGEQVPDVAVRLQAWQLPVQAVSQQTPSTQFPVLHWSVVVQVAPFACFGVQTPARQ